MAKSVAERFADLQQAKTKSHDIEALKERLRKKISADDRDIAILLHDGFPPELAAALVESGIIPNVRQTLWAKSDNTNRTGEQGCTDSEVFKTPFSVLQRLLLVGEKNDLPDTHCAALMEMCKHLRQDSLPAQQDLDQEQRRGKEEGYTAKLEKAAADILFKSWYEHAVPGIGEHIFERLREDTSRVLRWNKFLLAYGFQQFRAQNVGADNIDVDMMYTDLDLMSNFVAELVENGYSAETLMEVVSFWRLGFDMRLSWKAVRGEADVSEFRANGLRCINLVLVSVSQLVNKNDGLASLRAYPIYNIQAYDQLAKNLKKDITAFDVDTFCKAIIERAKAGEEGLPQNIATTVDDLVYVMGVEWGGGVCQISQLTIALRVSAAVLSYILISDRTLRPSCVASATLTSYCAVRKDRHILMWEVCRISM